MEVHNFKILLLDVTFKFINLAFSVILKKTKKNEYNGDRRLKLTFVMLGS